MAVHLSDEQRREVRGLRAEGLAVAEVARLVGCSLSTVVRTSAGKALREERRTRWCPSASRLSIVEREEISRGLHCGRTLTAIAATLGRATSTVSREVKANGGRQRYRAWAGHDRAWAQAQRPKPAKLDYQPLAVQVTAWLEQWWSPEQISLRLPAEFPHDPMMRVSHETIYQSIYVQGRGELRRELARCLRTGRAKRKARGGVQHAGKLPGMVMISERPAEVEDRAVPGHWEGDLIIGAGGRSAVGTLVERTSGYLLLLHLPDTHTAEAVDTAMRAAVRKLPGEFFRTITWDQGKEMAKHAAFTIDTGIQIYFCDPHSPWQRPSNENTNGLLRQYMPKGTDLSLHSEADLDRYARSLNDRPRKRLGSMKPSERLAQLLAMTP